MTTHLLDADSSLRSEKLMFCSVFSQTTKRMTHQTKQLRETPSMFKYFLFLSWIAQFQATKLASKQANVATYLRNVIKSFVKKLQTLIHDSYNAVVLTAVFSSQQTNIRQS